MTNQELNTALEAYRQDEFRKNLHAFDDNWNVTAPEVIWDYCGPHMICMERVVGVPMDDFEAHRRMGIDAEANLRQGMKAWVEAVAIHGPFHGDLHAGNIWALEDGRSCFLDFGIMGSSTPSGSRWCVTSSTRSWWTTTSPASCAGTRSWASSVGTWATTRSFGAMLAMVFEPIMASRMEDLQFADLFQQSLDLSVQMGDISTPEELNLLGKQFLYFERYVKGIAPDYLLVRDPFIIKNLFPTEAARLMDELRAQGPSMPVDPDVDPRSPSQPR
ncbi:MAG: AarF/UbiB family protein [Microthrixaceae bacterium]|nr:AarF/UbiB family protein [Microthrixaceae bacterium]